MSESVLPKPKKSVALSGTAAGNTAICTVGRTGNDLHYRGYDILDFAETCEFEEIAYLLIYGRLPTQAELAVYKQKLRSLRGLPVAVKQALEEELSVKAARASRLAVAACGFSASNFSWRASSSVFLGPRIVKLSEPMEKVSPAETKPCAVPAFGTIPFASAAIRRSRPCVTPAATPKVWGS